MPLSAKKRASSPQELGEKKGAADTAPFLVVYRPTSLQSARTFTYRPGAGSIGL